MPDDVRGLPITVANSAALSAYEDAVVGYLAHKRDTMDRLDEALEADPDFILAHCLKAYLLKMSFDPVYTPDARTALAAAEAASDDATVRERQHLAAVRAWLDEDLSGALSAWDALLLESPTDLMTLKLAQFGHFWRGDCANMRDIVGRALHAWDEDMPGYGFVLGLLAFGFEESGDYEAAERNGRRAVDLNAGDPWAVHAVAHTLEMQCRQADGLDWLNRTEPGWVGCNNFAYHIWWHRSLYHVERAEYEEAFSLYDTGIRGDQTDFAMDISNAAALLWRLGLRGVDVGDRWAELGERAEAHARDAVSTFFNTQYMMALLATDRTAAADALLSAMRDDTPRPDAFADRAADVSVAVAEAFRAFQAGDYARAVDLMLPVRYDAYMLGGSHAQRDVYEQTLLVSAVRSGREALARALVAERETRHRRVPDAWKAEAGMAVH